MRLHRPTRRLALMSGLISSLTMAGALTASLPAAAQGPADFPTRAVTIVTPFAPGSGPDAVLRLVGDKLGKLWNQQVSIENKPGGGGFIAINQVKQAAPDGYTLIQFDSEHLAALPYLYKSRNYNTLDTFEPVAVLFRTPFLLAVPTDSKVRSITDLVTASRSKPLNYGTWGVGSPAHLGSEWLESKTGASVVPVHYRDVGQLYTSVGAGDLDFAFATIPSSAGAYKAGKIRYLAVAAPNRLQQLPDVPTVAEAGGPAGFDVNSFVVLAAPKGAPAAVRARIAADVAKVLQSPDIQARFNTFAFETLPWTQAEIVRQADIKSAIYRDMIKKANIQLD